MAEHVEFRAQYKQDRLIDELLSRKAGGVFVDVGAHDGITLSNTYFFERFRGWTGVCFEPNPCVFQRLRSNRSCACENVGVAATAQSLEFLKVTGYAEMLSGFTNSYDPRHMQRIEREIARHGGTAECIRVPTVNLTEYLLARSIFDVDYLSIDTEGGEFEILRSLDYERVRIRILSVENNFWDQQMRTFMRSKGFKLLRVAQTDDIYGRTGNVPGSPVRERLLRFGGSLSAVGRVLERRLWG